MDPSVVSTVVAPPYFGSGESVVGRGRPIARGEVPLPTPEPGAEVGGVAAWAVGDRMPHGMWAEVLHVVVVGDRPAALAQARAEWASHCNGEKGFIYNGWLRLVAPGEEPSNARPFGITRNLPVWAGGKRR